MSKIPRKLLIDETYSGIDTIKYDKDCRRDKYLYPNEQNPQ